MVGLIEPYSLWQSKSGNIFQVIDVARHAQDCSNVMIVYQNLQPTEDAPALTVWVLDEGIFLKRMKEVNNGYQS